MKKNLEDFNTEKLFKDIESGINRFTNISEEGFISLAKYGWYLNGDIPLGYTTDLMKNAIDGNVEFLNVFFINFYKEYLIQLEKRLNTKNDQESLILSEAIECHLEKKYYASTILFLSQSDGICSGELFKTRNQKQSLKKYLKKFNNNKFISDLYKMVTNENTIDKGYSKLENEESLLNRHRIMHGFDTSYGTEINSLKAISLFSFLRDFVLKKI